MRAQDGVVAGLDLAALAFRLIDPAIDLHERRRDGARVEPGDEIASVRGPARGILTAERVALNFLCRLSGIATVTAALVAAVAGTRRRASSAPARRRRACARSRNMRCARAAASNHRFGLDDAVLIKDNHVAIAGGVAEAIRRARAHVGHLVKIEVEVDTLEQLEEALGVGADAVLLDNMSLDDSPARSRWSAAARFHEASGRVMRETAPAIAATGVDLISVGWLTHSAPVLDIGLDHRS